MIRSGPCKRPEELPRSSRRTGSTWNCRTNSIPEQQKVNAGLLEIARQLSLPLVATNDCHYLTREDARAHDILLCIQTGKTLKDPNRMRFSTRRTLFQAAEEMEALFSYCPEALANTVEIAERCNLELKLGPVITCPGSPSRRGDPGQRLRQEARQGLEDRLAAKEGDPAFPASRSRDTGSGWRRN